MSYLVDFTCYVLVKVKLFLTLGSCTFTILRLDCSISGCLLQLNRLTIVKITLKRLCKTLNKFHDNVINATVKWVVVTT